MLLGVTPKRCQNKAKASPMGRVKCTSSHSSVSSDFIEARSNVRNLSIFSLIIMYLSRLSLSFVNCQKGIPFATDALFQQSLELPLDDNGSNSANH